jgi:hypothetical protein
MTVSRVLTTLLLCTLAVSAAQAEEAAQGSGDSLLDKTSRAMHKGAKATANGAEYVAKKVVGGLETGARATGRALNSAADAVGIENGNNKAPAKSAPEKTSSADTNASR